MRHIDVFQTFSAALRTLAESAGGEAGLLQLLASSGGGQSVMIQGGVGQQTAERTQTEVGGWGGEGARGRRGEGGGGAVVGGGGQGVMMLG